MKHQYESEILFQLMERDGFNIPSSVPPYESEIKAYLINQVKQAYPKLTDYEAEWLLYNYTKHLPADFPISSATNVTKATFENVVPFAYQSAILKGQTLVNVTKFTGNANDGGFNYARYYSKDMLKKNTKYLCIWNAPSYVGAINLYTLNGGFIFEPNKETKRKFIITTNNTQDWGEFTPHFYPEDETGKIPSTDLDKFSLMLIEYQEGMENWDIPYFEDMKSVQMPVLTTSNGDGTKTNILTVNEDVTLRSNGNICDELNLLTGQLTQRIDEDGEVLSQESVKTVELKTVNESGESIHFMPLEGTMHVQSSGEPIQPTFDMSVPVEATTQNLASFIDLEMEE